MEDLKVLLSSNLLFNKGLMLCALSRFKMAPEDIFNLKRIKEILSFQKYAISINIVRWSSGSFKLSNDS